MAPKSFEGKVYDILHEWLSGIQADRAAEVTRRAEQSKLDAEVPFDPNAGFDPDSVRNPLPEPGADDPFDRVD